LAAEADLLFDFGDCCRQGQNLRRWQLEDVVSEALGAAGSDAWELGKLCDQALNRG
jgi:hypothetical protein